ncbi:uncharacterized protein EV420DRAFT_1681215 [Desarmillaria tabescens]|uniref:MYND-type domain-containing protein n=1 Tax=Armillaria tabescens TaxID=1929756 RepID=A0AA39KCK4_ARMTA|nr:uncharacterized protein EV420DRAFT_1681215 [Desarmillaria tabescens]KAK0458677.1 hypothetical protein EV420DRAFT_1681215 [Desarmillaria tabescens]
MDPAIVSAFQSAPRAYLGDMITLPRDYRMPDLSLVRSQAAEVIQLARAPTPRQGETIDSLPPGLWYRYKLPRLFEFSYFCSVDDIPEDILPQCIWSLEWWIRALLEGSDEQLKPFTKCVERSHPQINLPLEALYHVRCSMETVKEHGGESDIFHTSPGLYISHAICLARARIDDVEAKTALSRIIQDITFDAGSGTIAHHVHAKVYLARVLRRLGEDDEAQELEAWLVRWFKKYPHKFKNDILVGMFTTDIDPAVDPVFTGLGGFKWLDHRKATLKTVMRHARYCQNCGAREPQVKLLKCLQCQHTLYCSKECQKMNWRYHKKYCKDATEQSKRIAEFEKIGASAAQQYRDWMDTRDNIMPGMIECFAHALGLAHDESRGRTHIVLQEVEYVPSMKSRLDRFRTTRVGVFKQEDAWKDVGSILRLDPGEAKMHIRDMLEAFDQRPMQEQVGSQTLIPIFNLVFSAKRSDGQAYLRMGMISRKELVLMQRRTDWRRDINVEGEPPTQFKLRGGKNPDAEFIF